MIVCLVIFLLWIIPFLGRVFFVILLMLASVILGLYRRVLPIYLGLELVTFTTVVACFMVHPIFAWVVCLIVISAQGMMTGHITIHYFVKIGTYTFVVLFCAFSSGLGIELVGKIATVFINVIYFASNLALGDAQGLFDTPGNIINIFINFWLFSQTSSILELLM